MPHETRRAAREAAAGNARPAPSSPRHNRRRAIWITLACVLAVLLAAGAWLGFRALTVKNELEAAQQLLGSAGDDLSTADRITQLGEHARAAASAAADPVWRVAEFIPAAGDNLRAVRLASESIDVLANGIAVPALAALSADAGSAPLAQILPVLQDQAPTVERLAVEVSAAADSPALIGQVQAAIDEVDGVMQAASPALQVMPSLLGADGAKNYLLVFQNNAESLPLGGSAASQTLVTADAGKIGVTAQASSADFLEGVPVDVPVDQSALDLYSSYLVDHVNTTTSRPDFPTAAQLLRAFWNRDIGAQQIDGVVSIDPLALQRVLKATGPITVGDAELTSKNAASVLLKDVYEWWDPYASKADAAASDAFFATVATTVFDRLSSGDFDIRDMLWAVGEGIDNGDILMWSDDPELVPYLEGQRVAGVLPSDNDDQTTVGVFYRDTSASKIDYYMNTSIDLGESCADGTSTFTAQASLHLDLTQDQADDLPRYVKSAIWGGSQFRTEVFVYGPPGTTLTSVSVDGREVKPINTETSDLGRPVAAFDMVLKPGEAASVTAAFSGEGDFGPLAVRSTPMVRATEVAIGESCG